MESRVQLSFAILRANRSCPANENHLLPGQLLRRMRERDEAASQSGTALFLRRVRDADGPPELSQDRRRTADLRRPGGLRVKPDTTSESERARRLDSLGARHRNDA